MPVDLLWQLSDDHQKLNKHFMLRIPLRSRDIWKSTTSRAIKHMMINNELNKEKIESNSYFTSSWILKNMMQNIVTTLLHLSFFSCYKGHYSWPLKLFDMSIYWFLTRNIRTLNIITMHFQLTNMNMSWLGHPMNIPVI